MELKDEELKTLAAHVYAPLLVLVRSDDESRIEEISPALRAELKNAEAILFNYIMRKGQHAL